MRRKIIDDYSYIENQGGYLTDNKLVPQGLKKRDMRALRNWLTGSTITELI